MSWEQVHRRDDLVRAVLAGIAATGQPIVPEGLVEAEFGDFGEFLREIQHRWHRAFDARLDAVLEEGPRDMHAALVQLWHDLAGVMPAARLLLDAHADHPALAELHEQHRRTLYAATGVALSPTLTMRPPVPRQRWCRRFLVPRTSTA